MISKQKGIFNKLTKEKFNEITELDNKVDTGNLIWRYKGETTDEKFDEFDNAFSLLDKIRDGIMSIPGAKIDQRKFKSKLGEIKKGNNKKI